MAAKTAAEVAQHFAQTALSAAPVIILGSGASAAHGVPGMGALAAHLVALTPPSIWTPAEEAEWATFVDRLRSGADLESALQSIRPTDRQTRFIAAATRDFLVPFDLAVLGELLRDRRALPLTRLYQHLFDSTHMTIDVVTPNYDRLAEYAADAAEASTFTGFGYGYLQTRAKASNTRVTVNGRPMRTVAIWKVHGSLDWFQDDNNQNVGVRSAAETPATYTPLMITPGIDKYRQTHGEPFRTIISCSDAAMEKARAFLCIGYGFNDEHLQTKLVERCEQDAVPLVVITKELSATARSFLTGGRCRRYLAIEDGPTGAIAYMHDSPAGFDLDSPLWRLADFLSHVTGTRP